MPDVITGSTNAVWMQVGQAGIVDVILQSLGEWARKLELRVPRNKVIVAIANRLARITWAVLAKAEAYRHPPLCPQA